MKEIAALERVFKDGKCGPELLCLCNLDYFSKM